ncbi:MAG: hypothetical protein V4722_05130 [Bacteroidota bacterium]
MKTSLKKFAATVAVTIASATVFSQTDNDAIMMTQNNFCTGFMYQHSSWDEYWEGSFKRPALNMGAVSTQMFGVMGNYGIKDNLNLLFSLPYVKTKASAGTLHGMKGLQDLSLWVKYMPLEIEKGESSFSLYTIGGVSFPTTNYIADFLPLSIGLQSTNVSFRGMADYQYKSLFVTASATYVMRSNITIDRNSYYTTEMHYSNQVEMPDATQFNVRAGYRAEKLIAELIYEGWNTIGGYDIRKNDMPFPSNNMDLTRLGVNAKYTFDKPKGLSLIGGGSVTLTGRNVGKSNSVNGGVFYIIDFNKKKAKKTGS